MGVFNQTIHCQRESTVLQYFHGQEIATCFTAIVVHLRCSLTAFGETTCLVLLTDLVSLVNYL